MYGFSLFIAVGMTLGLAWSTWQASAIRRGDFPLAKEILNAGSLASLGMLLGARLFFISLHWTYYQEHFWETFMVFLGGLSWLGAVIGGAAGLGFAARYYRSSLGRLADGLLPFVFAVITSAWLGCWLDGCSYGAVTDSFFSLPASDEWGRFAWRFPIQLTGAAATLALYWLLDHLSGRLVSVPGRLSCLAASGLAVEVFTLSLFRADQPTDAFAALWGLSLESWAALLLLGLSGSALLLTFRKGKVELE